MSSIVALDRCPSAWCASRRSARIARISSADEAQSNLNACSMPPTARPPARRLAGVSVSSAASRWREIAFWSSREGSIHSTSASSRRTAVRRPRAACTPTSGRCSSRSSSAPAISGAPALSARTVTPRAPIASTRKLRRSAKNQGQRAAANALSASGAAWRRSAAAGAGTSSRPMRGSTLRPLRSAPTCRTIASWPAPDAPGPV